MEPLTRAEKLKVLASMGIELPQDTKLLEEVLDKRLRNALDAAQEKDRFPDLSKRLDLPAWPRVNAGDIHSTARPLLDAVKRGNMHEALQNMQAASLGLSAAPELFADPFIDLRQTHMSLANILDKGFMWCTIQDPDRETSAINIRFLKVYKLDDKTPAMVLLYRSLTRENAMDGIRCMNISATALEQKLLLKLLEMNRKILPPDFQPQRRRYEEQYRASVLLPIGPLGFEAISKLTHDTGCEVCGKSGTSRCGQCQSALYCSPACQKIDWPNHKSTCRSLKGGRWSTVTFRPTMPGMEHMFSANINRYTSTTRIADVPTMGPGDPSVPHADVHGHRPFLIKLQLGHNNMAVYDRQRSFSQVYIVRQDDPAAFADLAAEMAGPRGGFGGLKMYRWAKRTGDWELNICVDRRPETDIRW
ncbi:hypothetical protein VTO73DRAFT_12346 [Trametes versicolor]